ncbi:hypothetical protein ACIRD2_06895 [Streptomyces sp. NPDC093595]|uniref:hypothetical protein n=1 Tax=Streptomyces sp. NPDC093595 TaxID=3366045 RepID=UPI0038278F21
MYPGPPRWNARAQSWEYDAGEAPGAVSGTGAVSEAGTVTEAPGAVSGTRTEASVPAEPEEAASPDTPRHGAGRRPLTRPPVPWQPPGEDGPADGWPDGRGRGADGATPGPAGARPRPLARRVRPLVAGIAAGALVATAAWWLATGDGDGPGAAGRPASTAFPTVSPTAPGSDYRIADGPGGVSLAVPRDWSYQVNGTAHGYVAPDHASFLEVSKAPAATDPLEAARAFSAAVKSVWPNYAETSLGPVGDGPGAAVEVDFAYDAMDGSRRRGLYRVFTAPDDTVYGVQVAGPGTDWPRQREVMDTMLSTFYAPGAAF